MLKAALSERFDYAETEAKTESAIAFADQQVTRVREDYRLFQKTFVRYLPRFVFGASKLVRKLLRYVNRVVVVFLTDLGR